MHTRALPSVALRYTEFNWFRPEESALLSIYLIESRIVRVLFSLFLPSLHSDLFKQKSTHNSLALFWIPSTVGSQLTRGGPVPEKGLMLWPQTFPVLSSHAGIVWCLGIRLEGPSKCWVYATNIRSAKTCTKKTQRIVLSFTCKESVERLFSYNSPTTLWSSLPSLALLFRDALVTEGLNR